jgi:hypothetical protein
LIANDASLCLVVDIKYEVDITNLEDGNIIIILLLVKASLEFFPCLNFDFVAPVVLQVLSS